MRLTHIFPYLFAVLAAGGVLLDLQDPPSYWRFVLWTISNAGNLLIVGGVALRYIKPVHAFPASALYALYFLLAVAGLIQGR
jgi:hypothetical protein